ncbi:MAG: discoidin domain-containing protein, partial [Clostridia bacterium]|nr:discoidin domain-containing protein [Clostridia bacterium]
IPVNKIKYKILDAVGGCGVVAEFDLVKEDAALTEVALSSVEAETFVLETTETEAPKAENNATGFEAPPTTARKVEGEVPVDPRYVDKNGWTAYAEQSYAKGETAEKSIDGDPMTYWHSYFKTVDGVNQKAPMPYDMIYTLPSVATVSGFCYTPRQNPGSTSGIVLGYELYASADDSETWVKISEGNFTNDTTTKDVRFVSNIDVKKVMFRITSGLNGYAVIGEFDLMVKRDDLPVISLSEYEKYREENDVTYIDTDEIGASSGSVWVGHEASQAFDGSYDTFWHKDPDDKGLIVLKVDLGREYEVAGFVYYPRRADIKGHWKRYSMFASSDGEEYFPVLEDVTFDEIDFKSKDVRFSESHKMRYIEFEIEEYHGHAAAAEISFYQTGKVAKEEKRVEKYVLAIDNHVIKSEINGVAKETTLDVSPFIKNSNTMIPLRGLLEEMGATIEWNGENQSITVKKGLITIDMQIKRRQVYVTNAKGTIRYAFRTSPIIKDSRTFIPLRFISENLGYDVAWDGETRTITITTPEE